MLELFLWTAPRICTVLAGYSYFLPMLREIEAPEDGKWAASRRVLEIPNQDQTPIPLGLGCSWRTAAQMTAVISTHPSNRKSGPITKKQVTTKFKAI